MKSCDCVTRMRFPVSGAFNIVSLDGSTSSGCLQGKRSRQPVQILLIGRLHDGTHSLRGAGIGADEHVALLCRNRVEVLEVVLGGLLAGVWLTPVNWHLAAGEIGFVLRDAGARLVVVDPAP